MLQFWCAAFAVSIFFAITLLTTSIAAYFMIRQSVFVWRLVNFDADDERCTTACGDGFTLWPWPMFDRIVGAGFLFTTGFVPWSATPNELTSLLWIQCTLFFQLNVFVWSMLDTEFGLIQHKHFPDEWLMFSADASNQVNRAFASQMTAFGVDIPHPEGVFYLPTLAIAAPTVSLFLWVFMLALHVIATALPPYLDDSERQLLLEVVRSSPDGTSTTLRSSMLFEEYSNAASQTKRPSGRSPLSETPYLDSSM